MNKVTFRFDDGSEFALSNEQIRNHRISVRVRETTSQPASFILTRVPNTAGDVVLRDIHTAHFTGKALSEIVITIEDEDILKLNGNYSTEWVFEHSPRNSSGLETLNAFVEYANQ